MIVTKIIKLPIFTYSGIFGCFPKIEYLIFTVEVKNNFTPNKNESFADENSSCSKSSKNKPSKLK
tara:strand:- start:2102 stop:2296 length:195 start_codon:yes stop_codon:yes gene_type:complete